MKQERPTHPDDACARLLDALLPDVQGLLAALAPEEARAMDERLAALGAGRDREPPRPEDFEAPDLADADPEAEVLDLVGRCLWDVFSDNHEVHDAAGTYDLGSFRGAAGFLAGYLNARFEPAHPRYGYLDFYLGTLGSGGRADLTPVYAWLFEGLRAQGCNWTYRFPRLYLVSFAPDEPEEDDPAAYDPAAALQAALEREAQARETAALRDELDAAYREVVEAAQHRPPPPTVAAYRADYGRWPEGWPPRP